MESIPLLPGQTREEVLSRFENINARVLEEIDHEVIDIESEDAGTSVYKKDRINSLWTKKYEPRCAKELCMMSIQSKVEDMRKWLREWKDKKNLLLDDDDEDLVGAP